MLSKMRACIAGGHVLAHDSQGTSCASHVRQHVHTAIIPRFSMVCTTSDRFKTGVLTMALRDGPMCDAQLVLWSHTS